MLILTPAVCDRSAEPELRGEAARLAAAEQEKLQGGAGPGFISWITGAGAGTKLVFPTSSPACPWLAFFLLEVSPYQWRLSHSLACGLSFPWHITSYKARFGQSGFISK